MVFASKVLTAALALIVLGVVVEQTSAQWGYGWGGYGYGGWPYMGYGYGWPYMGYGWGGWYGKREAGFGPRGDSGEAVSSFAKTANNFGGGSLQNGDGEIGSKFARQAVSGFGAQSGSPFAFGGPQPQPFDSGHN